MGSTAEQFFVFIGYRRQWSRSVYRLQSKSEMDDSESILQPVSYLEWFRTDCPNPSLCGTTDLSLASTVSNCFLNPWLLCRQLCCGYPWLRGLEFRDIYRLTVTSKTSNSWWFSHWHDLLFSISRQIFHGFPIAKRSVLIANVSLPVEMLLSVPWVCGVQNHENYQSGLQPTPIFNIVGPSTFSISFTYKACICASDLSLELSRNL